MIGPDELVTPQLARERGIQPIPAYPLPTAVELPEGQVDWELDPARATLLVHDMQAYFLRPFAEEMRQELVARVATLVQRCRAAAMPVVYSAQPGGMTVQERGLLADFWGPGMSRDESDRAIVEELAPRPDDLVVTKWRYSAFARSPLADRLRDWGRDQLLICGIFAHVGILATASDALAIDVQAFVPADAIADLSPGYHRWAIDFMAQRCALVSTIDGLIG